MPTIIVEPGLRLRLPTRGTWVTRTSGGRGWRLYVFTSSGELRRVDLGPDDLPLVAVLREDGAADPAKTIARPDIRRTSKAAREAFRSKFEREVDPTAFCLSRNASAGPRWRKAHFLGLALKSAEVRRKATSEWQRLEGPRPRRWLDALSRPGWAGAPGK